MRAKSVLEDFAVDHIDQAAGVKILAKALEAPIRQIVSNSPDVVVNKILEGSDNYGYNAATGEYGDMMQMGIIDPVKVTKTALQNAASIAGLLITSDCSITYVAPLDEGNKPFDPESVHAPDPMDY